MKTISLTQNKTALVDDEDYDKLNRFKWVAVKRGGYWVAMRTTRFLIKTSIYMHREVMRCSVEESIVWKTENRLDNQKNNLLVANASQLRQHYHGKKESTSIYKGVSWQQGRNKWIAQIQINNQRKFIGRFDSEKDAAKAYDHFAREEFDKFARPNFI